MVNFPSSRRGPILSSSRGEITLTSLLEGKVDFRIAKIRNFAGIPQPHSIDIKKAIPLDSLSCCGINIK